GILPPRDVYFSGVLRKSTISCTSSLAPSSPATSLNDTFTSVFWSKSLARDFPMLKLCLLGPPHAPEDIQRILKIQTPMSNKNGKMPISKSVQVLFSSL